MVGGSGGVEIRRSESGGRVVASQMTVVSGSGQATPHHSHTRRAPVQPSAVLRLLGVMQSVSGHSPSSVFHYDLVVHLVVSDERIVGQHAVVGCCRHGKSKTEKGGTQN